MLRPVDANLNQAREGYVSPVPANARRVLPEGRIIGVSTGTAAQARKAGEAGGGK